MGTLPKILSTVKSFHVVGTNKRSTVKAMETGLTKSIYISVGLIAYSSSPRIHRNFIRSRSTSQLNSTEVDPRLFIFFL